MQIATCEVIALERRNVSKKSCYLKSFHKLGNHHGLCR